jgi:Fic family protein
LRTFAEEIIYVGDSPGDILAGRKAGIPVVAVAWAEREKLKALEPKAVFGELKEFVDGNGRMGRLWQTLNLMQENPIFEYLPIEIEIKNSQAKYYSVLSQSDKEGIATRFVEYMLDIIRKSLQKLIQEQRVNLTDKERILYFKEHTNLKEFTRKDYMNMFKDISTATASRDLGLGVEMGIFIRKGEGRNTRYEFRG